MKELRLEKQGTTYHCLDEDHIVYSGELTHSGSTYTMTLTNAFQEQIITISYVKSGFHLFRGSKPTIMDITMNDKQGTLTPQERTYTWDCHGVQYTFVCGEGTNRMDVIMRDAEDTLGYVDDHTMKLRHPIYSAELCAVWMIMQERKEYKDRVFMEPEKFARALSEVKQQW